MGADNINDINSNGIFSRHRSNNTRNAKTCKLN
jgi:hypothetical protein